MPESAYRHRFDELQTLAAAASRHAFMLATDRLDLTAADRRRAFALNLDTVDQVEAAMQMLDSARWIDRAETPHEDMMRARRHDAELELMAAE